MVGCTGLSAPCMFYSDYGVLYAAGALGRGARTLLAQARARCMLAVGCATRGGAKRWRLDILTLFLLLLPIREGGVGGNVLTTYVAFLMHGVEAGY